MIIVKGGDLINFDHISYMSKDVQSSEGRYVIQYFLKDDTDLEWSWDDESTRDFAYLSIIQSVQRKAEVCYLDGHVFDMLAKQTVMIKDEKKKYTKELLWAFVPFFAHFRNVINPSQEMVYDWVEEYLREDQQDGV